MLAPRHPQFQAVSRPAGGLQPNRRPVDRHGWTDEPRPQRGENAAPAQNSENRCRLRLHRFSRRVGRRLRLRRRAPRRHSPCETETEYRFRLRLVPKRPPLQPDPPPPPPTRAYCNCQFPSWTFHTLRASREPVHLRLRCGYNRAKSAVANAATVL